MKNHRLTISFIFLGVVMVSMLAFVVHSGAQAITSLNPYDNPSLGVDDVISLYHNNINTAFNNYIKLMMTNLATNPNDPNGKAYHDDGTPFTSLDCLNSPQNYSTFCVSVNLLGGNTDLCSNTSGQLSNDMQKICTMNQSSPAIEGYLNFEAAMQKRSQQVFQTSQAQQNQQTQAVYQTDKALEVSANIDKSNNEITFAKQALDETLSAYDQLRTAWPVHQQYLTVYKDLQTYRDKIAAVRGETDKFPSTFIDLTTTSCL